MGKEPKFPDDVPTAVKAFMLENGSTFAIVTDQEGFSTTYTTDKFEMPEDGVLRSTRHTTLPNSGW